MKRLNLAEGKIQLKKLKVSKLCSVTAVVGERRIWGEVRAEALVDCIRVRMPE